MRRFFKSQVGDGFKFNRAFMAWMKENVGQPLSAAVDEYLRLQADSAKPGSSPTLPITTSSTSTRATFWPTIPGAGLDDVRRVWALKRRFPSEDGRHRYARADLDLQG